MDRIEGIELLRKHENLPEGYKLDHEEILDDVQLKKLRILKMKYNAEKIQHKATALSRKDINSMAGDAKQMKKFEEDYEDEEMEENEDDIENLDSDEELEFDEDEELEEMEFDEDEELEEYEGDEEEFEEESLEECPELVEAELGLNEDESDSLEILSEEMRNDSEDDDDDEENVHGFVNPERLLTYKKRYRERIEELRNQQKEKYQHNRKEKMGGKTNKEKLKNKPLMMVLN